LLSCSGEVAAEGFGFASCRFCTRSYFPNYCEVRTSQEMCALHV
jgi:hypothetical protein